MTASPARSRTPRERARAELTLQIKRVALRQLGEHGAEALSLRAVARELGLGSASALYRYFPGRDALLTALIVDSYAALGEAAEAAERTVHDEPVFVRWVTVCHAVRAWALANGHEYALIFGTPIAGYAAPADTISPANRVPTLLLGLLADLVRSTDAEDSRWEPLPEQVRRAVGPLLATAPPQIPAHLVVGGLTAWTALLGAVNFEVFGHSRDIVLDPESFFDYDVRRIGVRLGLTGSLDS